MANATSRRGWSPATGNATKRAKRPTELLGGVVEAALQHVHQIGLKAINQPVLPADAARPEAGEVVFEKLRLARALTLSITASSARLAFVSLAPK